MLAVIGDAPREILNDPDASMSRAMSDRSALIILEGRKKPFLMPDSSPIWMMVDGARGECGGFVDQ